MQLAGKRVNFYDSSNRILASEVMNKVNKFIDSAMDNYSSVIDSINYVCFANPCPVISNKVQSISIISVIYFMVNIHKCYINYILTMDPLNEKPEKIAFIAYNIGIYESIQKFATLILAGKIDRSLDTNKIAELLADTVTFYDADMISQLINLLIANDSKSPFSRVDTNEVNYVIDQLKACGVSLP